MTTTQPPAIPTGINITAIRAVVERDLRAVRRSKAVVVPMLTVPVLLMVVLPLIVGYAARRASATGGRIDFLDSLPSQLADPIASLPQEEQLLTLVLGFLLAPLFLIVPLMVSAVLAADADAAVTEGELTVVAVAEVELTGDAGVLVADTLSSASLSAVVTWSSDVLVSSGVEDKFVNRKVSQRQHHHSNDGIV